MFRALLGPGAASWLALLLFIPAFGLVAAWMRPADLFALPPISVDRVVALGLRTLALAAVVSIGSLSVGTALAWLEVKARYFGARVLSLLCLLPAAVPSYLLATVVRQEFAPRGTFGELFGRTAPFSGFWPAVLVLTLTCTPSVQLLVAASLRRFPDELDEAARTLGATRASRFSRLYVPHLLPAWSMALLLVAIYTIGDFGAVAVLDCEVLTWELHKAGDRDAVLLGMALIALVVPALIATRMLERVVSAEGSQRAPATHRLPAWGTAAAVLLQAAVIGLGLFVPLVSMTAWLLAGLRHDHLFAPVGAHLWGTLSIAIASASLTAAIAFIAAWARGRITRWTRQAIYLAASLPAVLLAVGFERSKLYFGTGASIALGGTLFLAAMSAHFLGTGYASLEPAVRRLDPRLDEVARTLGASAARRFWRVSWPALLPALGASWVLLFVAAAKELPITLRLAPAGHQTLAFRVFNAQSESSLPDVGLAGLLLIALTVLVQLALLRWRSHV